MGIVVQKFGGTSVGDVDRIRRCAARVASARLDGHDVVVVVSAMGKTTDTLIDLARRISERPSGRELDLLLAAGEQQSAALMAMAIRELDVESIALAGPALGIRTTEKHGGATIRSIDADRLRAHFAAGRVVVAAGFQGVSDADAITTLGRGGSDLSAVAIAAALGVGRTAEGVCEIYTDVDGVYTADPRIVPGARRIERLAYEEMVELASLGAGVLHTRAGLCAQRYGVPLHVRHSHHEEPGTMVVEENPEMERVSVVGCALTPDLGRITLSGVPNTPGIQAVIFEHISRADILVDDIIQNETGDRADVAFTVEASVLADVKLAVQAALAEIGQGEMAVEVGLAKVSAVGVGMRTHTGVATTMFRALGDAGINIGNITTSEIKISCIVPREHGQRAMQVVHGAFGLDQSGVVDEPTSAGQSGQTA